MRDREAVARAAARRARESKVGSPAARLAAFAATALLAVCLIGCDEPEITRYEVPREQPSAPAPGPGETPAAPAADAALVYDIPEGWQEQPPDPRGIRLAAFWAPAEEPRAEVTVTSFPGDVGGLLANVNRWRREVGLGPVTEEEMQGQLEAIEVAGIDAHYVDLVGPESDERERTLGVIVPRAGQTWFFKMRGPADTVEAQKPAFEEFVQSVQFADGGEADE